jgi:hypothetical protein
MVAVRLRFKGRGRREEGRGKREGREEGPITI